MPRKTSAARQEKLDRTHLRDCPGAHDIEVGCPECERLRTVLRTLISSGSTTPIVQAMAMNTLDAGSGDAWLARQHKSVERNDKEQSK